METATDICQATEQTEKNLKEHWEDSTQEEFEVNDIHKKGYQPSRQGGNKSSAWKKSTQARGNSALTKEIKGNEQDEKNYRCRFERNAMDRCPARRLTCKACNKPCHFARACRAEKVGNINSNETKDCFNFSTDGDSDSGSDLEFSLSAIAIIKLEYNLDSIRKNDTKKE